MPLFADTRRHFTTISDFISTLEEEISSLFCDVLLMCDRLKLIGKEMFAIDGCKMPSNASKGRSGTREDFKKKYKKLEKTIRYILKKHRREDAKEGLIYRHRKISRNVTGPWLIHDISTLGEVNCPSKINK